VARELLIFRHGKAVAKKGVDDYQRSITDRGKRGAQRIGVWLWQKDLRPDYIISSPAERAQVSAQKLCKAMGFSTDSISLEKRLYDADIQTLLDLLAECPAKKQRILIVGHNPGLVELLLFLLGGKVPLPDDGKLMPTATLARLKMPDNWRKLKFGCAQLKALTRPDDLPKKFPFPAPHGKEKRDRPAYYYRQSALIPYRLKNDKPQLLLIGSSKQNHWVVPKGIHEPGLSAQESAAREALEEAGITGHVDQDMIGKYEYRKWGASCKVEVYSMQVDKILPDNKWQEAHRGRRWVTADEAIKLIKEPAMRPMIKSLVGFITREK
jgi:phosphohistidine phosphatase